MKQYIASVRIRKLDRSGNTYHDVHLLDMDGILIDECEKVYGYGQQYKQTTANLINASRNNDAANYYNVDDIVVFVVNNF